MTKQTIGALGDLCEVIAGGTPSRSNPANFGGSIPWVKIGDMLRSPIVETEETITEKALESSAAKISPAGTVLISIFATIGRTAVLGIDAATNQAIAGVIPRDRSSLSPGYLRAYLDSIVSGLKSRARGVAQPNINSAILRSLQIPLPPLSDQLRITGLLERAEALRAKRRAALALLDTLAQSIFLDLFGDPATNPMGWQRVRLGDLVADGPQNGLYKPSTDYGSGTPIVRIDAFYDGVITKWLSLKRVRVSDSERTSYGLACGDILVNRVNSREYLGKSAVVPQLEEPVVFESNMMRFRVDPARAAPRFVVHFLQTAFVKQQIARAAKDAVNQSSVNQSDVKGFEINLPPLSLQQEFAARMDAVATLKAAHRASLAQLDALFASLQHRAFRGEL